MPVKKLKITLYLILVCSTFTTRLLASSNEIKWQLVTDDNGIQVYTLETPGTNIVKAKATTVLRFPIIKLKETLDDIEHRHEWIPFLMVSKPLTDYVNNQRIEYSHFYGPWPASDRDFVYEIKLLTQTKDRLVYKMQSVTTQLMPVTNDKVRANLIESIYTLTALDATSTQVELIFHADPRGWVPNWIINIIQRALPYKIMKNLTTRLETGQN